MNENTTKGETKMDKERIAELRAKLDALGRTNFAEPFEGWIGLATELLDALEAALARAEGAGWQPIETAPKDGTRILVWIGDDFPMVAKWKESKYGSWWNPCEDLIADVLGACAPTHWMPLPAAPEPRP